MHLTKYQLDIIGQRLPEMLEGVRQTNPAIHSLGVGRVGEDHAIVIFTIGPSVDPATREAVRHFIIEGEPVDLDTDIVQCAKAKFAYCDIERPVLGGNCVATKNTQMTGTLGGAIVKPETNEHYLISAAHLLTRFGTKGIGSEVIQPSDDGSAMIGRVARLGPDWPAVGGPMKADAALASVAAADISYEIYDIGEISGFRPPEEDMDVLVRGAVTDDTMSAKIVNVKCATIVTRNQIDYTFSNVFCTPLLSQGGDSGSLAVEKRDAMPKKVVGLLFAHNDKFTYYADVEDCIDVLEISGWYWGRPT